MDGAVVVHDRYQNYDAFPGLIHQLCCQHLLRDLEDAAQAYPGAHWPVQVTQALQELIHAASTARAKGLPAVPDDVAAPLVRAFRHGVILGLGQVKRVPGRKQQPCRDLLECLRDRRGDVLRFTTDLRIPPTSNPAVIRSPVRVHAGCVSRPRPVQRRMCLTGRLRPPGAGKGKRRQRRGGCETAGAVA